MTNKDLLKAIDAYRNGWAEAGSLEWDTLMYFFKDDCVDYTIQALFDKWYDDSTIDEVLGTADEYPYFCDFLDMYLCN